MSNYNRVALVSGASRGIGAAISRHLAAQHYSIVVNYAASEQTAAALVSDICRNGGKAIAVRADVGKTGEVSTMFDEAEAALGAIDVVINNAGIMQLESVAHISDDMVDAMIATNFKGTLNVCREAARRLSEGGRIINLSTSVIAMRLPTYGVYAATKAAVECLTQILAQEMRGRAITVNAVAPGPTATDLFLTGKSDELVERLAKLNPLERLAEPADIARVVAFLAGPEGSYINGQIIRVNGGMC